MSKVDDFVKFSQEDGDEYVLRLFGDDAPDGEWELSMSTATAVELFEALEKTLGDYIFEMRAAKAAYDRDEGPNDNADAGYAVDDPKYPDYLEGADTLRDSLRPK